MHWAVYMCSNVEPSERRVCSVQRLPDKNCSRKGHKEGSSGGRGVGGTSHESNLVFSEQVQLRDVALSHQAHKLLGLVHSAAVGKRMLRWAHPQPLQCAARCSSERSWGRKEFGKSGSQHEKTAGSKDLLSNMAALQTPAFDRLPSNRFGVAVHMDLQTLVE